MNIASHLDELKNIQDSFLEFLENSGNSDESYNNLKIKFEEMKIRDNQHDLRLLLHFISRICENYGRVPSFFSQIERTLQLFKDSIKKYYSNSEIFNIFKENKRILLFLIKEKIMTVDESFVKKIATDEFVQKYYPQYFAPEIKPFVNESTFYNIELYEYLKREIPDDFNELRDKGENDSFICKLIREDLVEDFIAHVNKKCISSNSVINPSIYETNSLLLKKQNDYKGITLIEYAAFFGSIQIFTFLKNIKAELKPSLWIYAIHSKNAELIHLLEKLHVEHIYEESYKYYIKESIKCHHNDITNYFINIFLHNEDEISDETFIQSLEYYNFSFLRKELINKSSFCYLCKFDYYSLVKYFLTREDVDINRKEIQNQNF